MMTDSLPDPDPLARPQPISPLPIAAPPQSQPKAAVPPRAAFGLRLLLTGRNLGPVITALRALEFGILSPVRQLAGAFFPGTDFSDSGLTSVPGAAKLIATLRAYGAAEVTEEFPLTSDRATFITMIRSMASHPSIPVVPGIDWKAFGKSDGFWIDATLAAAKSYQEANPESRFVITGVTSQVEFDYFRTLGLQHWHVMARPGVGVADSLGTSLDGSVTRQVSQVRQGPKLRCIWNDNSAPISSRLWTMPEVTAHV
jgi:hypothetical protein